MLAERFGLGADDVGYLSMPLFHSNAVMAGWGAGARRRRDDRAGAKFSASRFLPDVRRYGATYANYVGKPLAYVLATPEQPDDADNPLRIAFGNEAGDRDIAEFARRFGCVVVDGFGSTENAVIVTRVRTRRPARSAGRSTASRCSIPDDRRGVPARGVRRDRPAAQRRRGDRRAGQHRRRRASSPATTTTRPPTAERMRGGMYWSGDLAYRDADGFVYFAGRTGDWLRVDGENLAAAPIERILLRHPDVSRGRRVRRARPVRRATSWSRRSCCARRDLDAGGLEAFLAAQADLGTKAWPRYVRIVADAAPHGDQQGAQARAAAADGVDGVPEPCGRARSAARRTPRVSRMPLYEFEGKRPVRPPVRVRRPDRQHHRRRHHRGERLGLVRRRCCVPTSDRSSCERVRTCRTGRCCTAAEHLTCEIGEGATIGHSCMVHGADHRHRGADRNGAIVLDGAQRRGTHPRGRRFGGHRGHPWPASFALGAPARVKGPLEGTNGELWVAANPQVYRDLAQRHRAGIKEPARADPVAPARPRRARRGSVARRSAGGRGSAAAAAVPGGVVREAGPLPGHEVAGGHESHGQDRAAGTAATTREGSAARVGLAAGWRWRSRAGAGPGSTSPTSVFPVNAGPLPRHQVAGQHQRHEERTGRRVPSALCRRCRWRRWSRNRGISATVTGSARASSQSRA